MVKWNKTPNLRMGCITNCMIGLVPMKCEASLYIVPLTTDKKLMATCKSKKEIRKKADTDIATFFPIELNKKLIIIVIYIDEIQSYI